MSAVVDGLGPGQRTRFTPDRIAIETITGGLVSECLSPRSSFGGHLCDVDLSHDAVLP
jgi:hypothetical protein